MSTAPLPQTPLDPALEARRLRIAAIALMCAAIMSFAILDTTAKYLASNYHPMQVAWLRYLFHVLIVVAWLNPWRVRGVWRSRRPGLQLARSILLAGSTVLNFAALSELRLDQAVAIAFTAPLLVAALAGPLLGEWIGRERMIAVMVGFLGVVLVTRPGFGDFELAYLFAFGNAFCYAFYAMATRKAAAYDSSQTSIALTGLFGVLILAPLMPFVWAWPENPWHWALFVGTGAFGAGGHFLLILAHARAPAPVLAPFVYMELLWMSLLGWLVFSDMPDGWTIAGAGVVIGAGLFLLWRERQR